MTSENIDTSNSIVNSDIEATKSGITSNTDIKSIIQEDIKSIVQDSMKDPDLLKAMAMAFQNIEKEKEGDETIKLDARKRIEAEAKRTKMEDANNALSGDWYNKRCEVDKLPFGINRQKEVVNEELDRILIGVENKTISYMEASDLLNTAVIKEELDLDDERLKLDPKYSLIKDLFTKSNVRNRCIVNPDVLNYAFDQTKIQMKMRSSARSATQRQEHANFNSNYTRGSSVSIEDCTFSDLVNMSIIGADRINPMFKDATKEQYQKVYKRQFDKFLRDTKNEKPKVINY